MRITQAAACLALVGVTVLAGGATALADTGAPHPVAVSSEFASRDAAYKVTTWHEVTVRQCAGTTCATNGKVDQGDTVPAYCWAHGESITDAGITNDVWLQLGNENGGTQWASAVYFQGDQYANLPASAQCAS